MEEALKSKQLQGTEKQNSVAKDSPPHNGATFALTSPTDELREFFASSGTKVFDEKAHGVFHRVK